MSRMKMLWLGLALLAAFAAGWYAGTARSGARYTLLNTKGSPVRMDRQTGQAWYLYHNPPRWVPVQGTTSLSARSCDCYHNPPRWVPVQEPVSGSPFDQFDAD